MALETDTNFCTIIWPCSDENISSSCAWNLAIVLRMRRKSEWLQLIAPASGGWFFESGGLSWCVSKSELTCSSSVSYCERMSAVLRSMSFACASDECAIVRNFCRRSKAPSALRSLPKESSMNFCSVSLIAATFSLNLPIPASHDVW